MNYWTSILLLLRIIIIIIVVNLMAPHPKENLSQESLEGKFHSVWLLKKGNSCTSVFPNTWAWEQQEQRKMTKKWIQKQKRVKRERTKSGYERSPDGLDKAWAYHPPRVATPQSSG